MQQGTKRRDKQEYGVSGELSYEMKGESRSHDGAIVSPAVAEAWPISQLSRFFR